MAIQLPIAAVVDTNVILDVFSPTDLLEAYKKGGDFHREAEFRRARARESLLLAWHLHSTSARTLQLPRENVRLMVEKAKPGALDQYLSVHVQLSIYLIKERVLERWHDGVEAGCDDAMRGTACDDKLLELSARYSAPLVTNEGHSPDGISDEHPKKLRRRALDRRIDVRTPRQFWSGKLDEDTACQQFLARVEAAVPGFVGAQSHRDAAQVAVSLYRRVLRHILLGETSSEDILRILVSSAESAGELFQGQ